MFWRWNNLKRVYFALAAIAAIAFCALWAADAFGAPDWLTPAICLIAFGAWLAVGAITAMKQRSDNQRTGDGQRRP
jgi:amino acid transporter